jgi:predicted transcriptional regulator
MAIINNFGAGINKINGSIATYIASGEIKSGDFVVISDGKATKNESGLCDGVAKTNATNGNSVAIYMP